MLLTIGGGLAAGRGMQRAARVGNGRGRASCGQSSCLSRAPEVIHSLETRVFTPHSTPPYTSPLSAPCPRTASRLQARIPTALHTRSTSAPIIRSAPSSLLSLPEHDSMLDENLPSKL